ncbi:MAG: hypothetical protein ABR574_09390 [Cryomorphaceae bacterium]
MNLDADITWIQNEIAKIKDPDLIDVFKSLLKYREKKTNDETLDMYLERSFKDIDEDRTSPHSEVRKKYDKWL